MALISVSNNALSNITALPASIPTGALTLIKSITASSSASIEFINGTNGVVLDGTYTSYVFSFVNMHPANNSIDFRFNGSTDSGSNYNVTKTSTFFESAHYENDSLTNFRYRTDLDLAQSTAFQPLTSDVGNLDDECASGTLTIFNPSSTTFVKHYISTFNCYVANDQSQQSFVAGYFNTTSAINAIQFSMSSGNIDDGIIKMYGVS